MNLLIFIIFGTTLVVAQDQLQKNLDILENSKLSTFEPASNCDGGILPPCETLRGIAKIGERCLTSKGFEFVRTKDKLSEEIGWEDVKTKIIWFDEIKASVDQPEAQVFCDGKIGYKLPSKSDFITGEDHGIREVIHSNDFMYWTSTHYPDLSLNWPDSEIKRYNLTNDKAVGFEARNGRTYSADRKDKGCQRYPKAVLCIYLKDKN